MVYDNCVIWKSLKVCLGSVCKQFNYKYVEMSVDKWIIPRRVWIK